MSLDVAALRRARVLFVGAGGLGSPASLALARTGVGEIRILDDDTVDASNLHRQLLFSDADVGTSKVASAVSRLSREAHLAGHATEVVGFERRFVPETALTELAGVDLVIEGADNMATKFLVADACSIANVPLVQAGAIRWNGWAFARNGAGGSCLRCVFEDLPARQNGEEESCSLSGVVGPVVGVLGALEALLAVRLLGGDAAAAGELWSYDALRGAFRKSRVRRREGCPLCSGSIRELSVERYLAPSCAA